MAKFDILSNHKRGLFNSTVGNAFRGGLLGTVLCGAAALIAAVAFPPALPFIAMAAIAVVPGMALANGAGGLLRWGAETAGGVIGTNRKGRGFAPDHEPGYEQEQGMQQSRGISGSWPEMITALVGAAMMFSKTKNVGAAAQSLFGQQPAPAAAPANGAPPPGAGQAAFQQGGQQNGMGGQQGGAQQRQASYDPNGTIIPTAVPVPPRMPDSISSRIGQNGSLTFTTEELANPKLRDEIDGYGQAMQQYHARLGQTPGYERYAQDMSNIRDNAVSGRMATYDREKGTHTFEPYHLMNNNIRNGMLNVGLDHQRAQSQAPAPAAPEKQASPTPEVAPVAPAAAQPQQERGGRHSEGSGTSFEETMRRARGGQATQEGVTGTKPMPEVADASAPLPKRVPGEAAAAAGAVLLNAGASHVGGANSPRAGSGASAPARQEQQAR